MGDPAEEHTPQKELPGAGPPGYVDDDLEDDDDLFEAGTEVKSDCRCGECCRMIIETEIEDAKREPKIAERGSPIYMPAEVTESGQMELVGYLLNDEKNQGACTFLDTSTNLCSIYENQP